MNLSSREKRAGKQTNKQTKNSAPEPVGQVCTMGIPEGGKKDDESEETF